MSKLTPKMLNFCIEYVKDGNATRAYKASYNTDNMKEATASNSAYKLLQKGEIRAKIDSLTKELEDDGIMSIKELQKFWSDVIKEKTPDEKIRLNDKLKASELLGKSKAAFTENNKTELTGSGPLFQINLKRD